MHFTVGCFLAFCGYLVRSQEFLLVLLIALPLLPWEKMVQDRSAKVAALLLLLAIGSAIFVDRLAYQDEEWQAFNALNPARAPLTDFGADVQLKQHPDILSRHGYSPNDIDLIRSWFFVDPKIANPVAINAMLAEMGPQPVQRDALTNGWAGIKALAHPILIPTLSAAILLMLSWPSRKTVVTWVLCVLAFFALGMLGRPGVLRVYIPVLSLLLILPFLAQQGSGLRAQGKFLCRRLAQSVIFVAAFFNTAAVLSESRTAQITSEEVRWGLDDFPNETVVLWGGVFPYEAAYPVLKQGSAMRYQLYGLGVSVLAPLSRAYAEQKSGRGMVDRLISQNGVPVIANEQRLGFLSTYCKEHFDGVLMELANHQYGQVRVTQQHCESRGPRDDGHL